MLTELSESALNTKVAAVNEARCLQMLMGKIRNCARGNDSGGGNRLHDFIVRF
jgi:hypothetical protein